MATYYYNWFSGSNSTGDGSLGNPWKYPISSHGAAGDTYLLRRGQEFYTDTANGWTPRMANGVGGLWTTVDTYGDSDTNMAVLDTWNTSGPTINISASTTANSNLRFNNLWIKATGHASVPLFLHANQTDLRNISLKGVRVSGRSGGSTNALLFISSDFPETMNCYNILVESSIFENGQGHGALTISAANVTFRNCIARNNGLGNGAHGFSSFRVRQSLTSGWTGGPSIYQQSFTYSDITAVNILSGASAGTYPKLLRNTSTPTTPAIGEYGYTGGILYINLNGSNPNGQTIQVAYGLLSNIRYEFCEAYENRAFPIYPYWEGHGIALDDYSGESFIIGCHLHDNEGMGLSLNRGDNNLVQGNLIYNNGRPGVVVNIGVNNRIRNNTIVNNNTLNQLGPFVAGNTSEVAVTSMSTGTNVQNNIIQSTRDFGMSVDASSASGSAADRNNVTGFRNAVASGITATNTTQLDPQFDSEYRPQTALQGLGNNLGGVDFYGKPFKAAPTLGAIELYNSTNTTTLRRGVVG